jgi:short-subunit dehydrogenase/ribosomal 50S subunit-recycling heat shock protein
LSGLPAALITGASSGIGAAFVPPLARGRARMVLTGRNAEALETVAREAVRLGAPSPLLVPLDLTAPGAVDRLLEVVAEAGLHVDELVNNAGYGLNGPALELSVADQLGIVDLNARVATEIALKVLPGQVARRRGGVLNVASVAGFVPGGPHMAVYYASKAYLLSLSEALAEEVAATGVRVTALCPHGFRPARRLPQRLRGRRLWGDVGGGGRAGGAGGFPRRTPRRGAGRAQPGGRGVDPAPAPRRDDARRRRGAAPARGGRRLSEPRIRLDKWLWHIRLVKTRPLAVELIQAGHVRVNSARVSQAGYPLKRGDVLTIGLRGAVLVRRVVAFGERRGPAVEAQTLYEEIGAGRPPPGDPD